MESIMNKIFLLLAMAGLSISAQAAEYAKVISSTPVLGEISTPQRNCWNEEVQVQQPKSPEGTVIGAIAGGLLGSTMGRGSGKAAATAVGVVTGAVVGNSVTNNETSTQNVRRCQTTTTTQRQVIGYDVTYEYAGQRYTSRFANDPGDRVAININPSGASSSDTQTTTSTTTIVEDSPTVVYRRAPTVYVDPYYGWWGPGPGPHRGPWH
jgi:uncharacterized protein YcfJ